MRPNKRVCCHLADLEPLIYTAAFICKTLHAFLLGSGARLALCCRAPASLYKSLNWNPKIKREKFGNIIKLAIIILCVLGSAMFFDYHESGAAAQQAEMITSRTKIQYKVNSLHFTNQEPPNKLYYKNVQRANAQDYRAAVGKLKKIGPIPRTIQLIRQLYHNTPFYLAERVEISDLPLYATWRRSPKDKHYNPTTYNYCCGYYPVTPEPDAGREGNRNPGYKGIQDFRKPGSQCAYDRPLLYLPRMLLPGAKGAPLKRS